MPEVVDRLLTVKELALYLDVSVTWVYQRVNAAATPHLRIGRMIRFRAEEIEKYLHEHHEDELT